MVKIIAEIGVNHNGDLNTARELIFMARKAGCDAVKFQTFWHFDKLKHLELGKDEHRLLKLLCDFIGIEFISTPFSIEAIDFLKDIGLKTWKIPSGLITSKKYLEYIAKETEGSLIMSTGMADIDEIRAAVDILFAGGCRHELTILQCTTSYPCPYEDVNLGVIPMLQQLFGLPVGISDHSIGIEVPIAAVALGAVVVEKHFTMDRCDPGPDHKASIEFDDMVRMVKSIRNIEMAMGDGIKRPTTAELLSRDNIRACQNVI